jgi:hypothetical protein
MLPLNLKDSKGNQDPVKGKEIWGHCTAVPHPGTKSINSKQCPMTRPSHFTVWETRVCIHSSPGRAAGWNEVAPRGESATGHPHTAGNRGPKAPTVASGPTLSALADRGLGSTTLAICCKGLYPISTHAQPHPHIFLLMCPGDLPGVLQSIEIT